MPAVECGYQYAKLRYYRSQLRAIIHIVCKDGEMKTASDLENEIVAIIKSSSISEKIRSVSIFGSHAKGEESPESDVDILVDLIEPVGFPFLDLEYQLSEKLGRKVDMLTTEGISPYLRQEIMNTKKVIYER